LKSEVHADDKIGHDKEKIVDLDSEKIRRENEETRLEGRETEKDEKKEDVLSEESYLKDEKSKQEGEKIANLDDEKAKAEKDDELRGGMIEQEKEMITDLEKERIEQEKEQSVLQEGEPKEMKPAFESEETGDLHGVERETVLGEERTGAEDEEIDERTSVYLLHLPNNGVPFYRDCKIEDCREPEEHRSSADKQKYASIRICNLLYKKFGIYKSKDEETRIPERFEKKIVNVLVRAEANQLARPVDKKNIAYVVKNQIVTFNNGTRGKKLFSKDTKMPADDERRKLTEMLQDLNYEDFKRPLFSGE